MNSVDQSPLLSALAWQEECARLLGQPFRVSENLNREGQGLGLRILSLPHPEPGFVDVALALFPLWLLSPKEEETEPDRAAFQVFLAGLQSTDFRDRLSACTALGQLGNEMAREGLHTASRDENRFVRAAAARALTALDRPQVAVEALAGRRLFLQQQVQYLWKPLAVVETNQRGEAYFTRIPTEATCRLLILSESRKEVCFTIGRLAAKTAAPEKLAAAGKEPKASALPQSHRLALEDGSLLCTIYRDEQDYVVLAFRSDAQQLQNRAVHVEISDSKTRKTRVDAIVYLEPNARGILTGKLELDRLSEFTEEHEIRFEPLPES